MDVRFFLGTGREMYSIPTLVDGASFLFSYMSGQSADRGTRLPSGQHHAWVLCGLKIMILPYKKMVYHPRTQPLGVY